MGSLLLLLLCVVAHTGPPPAIHGCDLFASARPRSSSSNATTIPLSISIASSSSSTFPSLAGMLERYHGALSRLTPVEANLMQVQLAKLRTALRPGFTPLNWNSLHIGAYISEVSHALQDIDSVLTQVRGLQVTLMLGSCDCFAVLPCLTDAMLPTVAMAYGD